MLQEGFYISPTCQILVRSMGPREGARQEAEETYPLIPLPIHFDPHITSYTPLDPICSSCIPW